MDRNMIAADGGRRLMTRFENLEYQTNVQTTMFGELAKLNETLKAGKSKPIGCKPVDEHEALQSLDSFHGDRVKFREWNDKLSNAMAQVRPSYGRAIKHLSKQLETLDGVIPDDEEEDVVKHMNGRSTAAECAKASTRKRQDDYDEGQYELTEVDSISNAWARTCGMSWTRS